MVKRAYIPERGDVVWLDFIPQAGHEQMGRRPAVILSPAKYNRIGLAICCPVTSHAKGYPFEVSLPASFDISGVVLCDQIKNVDWKARDVKFIDRMSSTVLHSIVQRVVTLIDPKRM